ncbi:MAG: glycosyltransferase [Chitinivibrionales bacterium]|nr:glycosyltransferase [Chitinivibrionales bacterium]
MKVLALARYGRLGSSSRIRIYQYLPFLKAHGLDVTVSSLLDDSYLIDLYYGKVNQIGSRIRPYLKRWAHLRKRNEFDLLWVQNELFPWIPEPLESILRGSNLPWVLDYDDAWFHRYNLQSNSLIVTLLGKKIDSLIRSADCVFVGSKYLYDYAESLRSDGLVYLPSTVDTRRYSIIKKPQGPFTIGWIGNPQTATYIGRIQPVLDQFCERTGSRIVLVGAGTYNAAPFGIVLPWNECTEVEEINSFDVGIMPLADTPWERGKCGYKLIQYMACGKPVIASMVGENTSIVDHMINGYLVESESQWYEALSFLLANPKVAKAMGALGRTKVEKKYSLNVTAPVLLKTIIDYGCRKN